MTGNTKDAAPISDPPASAPTISLRIDFPSGARLGPGKALILELIDQHGSISAAGRALSMSYRRAWTLVEALNTMFSAPLVTTQTGGAGGGRAALTPSGHEVLRLFRALEMHAATAPETLAALHNLLPQSVPK